MRLRILVRQNSIFTLCPRQSDYLELWRFSSCQSEAAKVYFDSLFWFFTFLHQSMRRGIDWCKNFGGQLSFKDWILILKIWKSVALPPLLPLKKGGESDSPDALCPAVADSQIFHPKLSLKYSVFVCSVGLMIELSPCRRKVYCSILSNISYFDLFL